MVCRSTHVGNLSLSLIKAAVPDLTENQAVSLYHRLHRTAPSPMPVLTEADTDAVFDAVVRMIAASEVPANRKTAMTARAHLARMENDPRAVFLKRELILSAAKAEAALDAHVHDVATVLGVTADDIRDRIKASEVETRMNRSLRAPRDWNEAFKAREGCQYLPMDRHTAYALWRLDNDVMEQVHAPQSKRAITEWYPMRGMGPGYKMGYCAKTGRLEVRMPAVPPVAHRDIPASLVSQINDAPEPYKFYFDNIRSNPNYQYPTKGAADRAAHLIRCGSCGQFTGTVHACPEVNSALEATYRGLPLAETQRTVLMARLGVGETRDTSPATESQRQSVLRSSPVSNRPEGIALSPFGTEGTHTYYGEHQSFKTVALSTVKRLLRDKDIISVPVAATVTHVVGIDGNMLEVEPAFVEGTLRVSTSSAGHINADPPPSNNRTRPLRCTCIDYRERYECNHIRQLVNDYRARANQTKLRLKHSLATSLAYAQAEAGENYERSLAGLEGRREQWEDGNDGYHLSTPEGAERFRDMYEDIVNDALDNPSAPVVEYRTHNVLDGLADPDSGRGIGIELEFDLPFPDDDPRHMDTLADIGEALHAAGLVTSPDQQDYHASKEAGYSTDGLWAFEKDSTSAGELVSNIMHDTPENWERLAKVCEVLREHGAVVNPNNGLHVHVSTGDYDHRTENHHRLIQNVRAHEDTFYRLGTNPATGQHRTAAGSEYTDQNPYVPSGYVSLATVKELHSGNYAVNFDAASEGRRGDHVEFRIFDATLDPGTIQGAIQLAVRTTESAYRDQHINHTAPVPQGTLRGESLNSDSFDEDTANFRGLLDQLCRREEDKKQLTQLFVATTGVETRRPSDED